MALLTLTQKHSELRSPIPFSSVFLVSLGLSTQNNISERIPCSHPSLLCSLGACLPRQRIQLILNLTTGTAKGTVTILPAKTTGESNAPPHQDLETPSFCSSAESVCRCHPRRRRRRRGWVQEISEGNGYELRQGKGLDKEESGEGKLHLLISLSPAWAQRFNRPVLSLESLPAPVFSPSSSPLATTLPAPAPAPAPPNIQEGEEGTGGCF